MNEYFKNDMCNESNKYHRFFNFDALEKLTFLQIWSVKTAETSYLIKMYSIITFFLYIKGEFIRPKFFNQLSEKNNKMYGIY